MLTYNTSISASPPITPAMKQSALAGLKMHGRMEYPGSAQDVYDARSQEAAIDYERAAAGANNKFTADARQAQNAAALQGLRLIAQEQQNQDDMATKRQQMGLTYAGQVFGGLNGLLSGLFDNV